MRSSAIAASAPILQFTDNVACEAFARIATSDYRVSNPTCPQLIRKAWHTINDVTSNGKKNSLFSDQSNVICQLIFFSRFRILDEGKKWLSDSWKLCEPLKTAEDVKILKDFLQNVYINLAMVNYPYETDFLAPLPGNPINVSILNSTIANFLSSVNSLIILYPFSFMKK
jgi:lysosomal Pro-X carboxypeptidase